MIKTLTPWLAAAICAISSSAHGMNLFQMATRGIDLNALPDKTSAAQYTYKQNDLIITFSYKKSTDGRYSADKITSISNISEVVHGCTNHFIEGRVDQVSFNSTRMPEAVSVANSRGKDVEVFELNDFFSRMPMSDHDFVRNFFRRDAKVLVTYQRCGASGRIVEMRDIFAK